MATVIVSGPIFDGRADQALEEYYEDVTRAVGAQGLALVHSLLDQSIRNPTPYYETQLLLEAEATEAWVRDRDIIYGPWLEGVGSRNQTTRFKGYWSFRRATSELRTQVPAIAHTRLQHYLPRMGAS